MIKLSRINKLKKATQEAELRKLKKDTFSNESIKKEQPVQNKAIKNKYVGFKKELKSFRLKLIR